MSELVLKEDQLISPAGMHTSREGVAIRRWERKTYKVVSPWHLFLMPVALAVSVGGLVTAAVIYWRGPQVGWAVFAFLLTGLVVLIVGTIWQCGLLLCAGERAIEVSLPVIKAYENEREIFKALSKGLSPETVIPHLQTFLAILRDERTAEAWQELGCSPLEPFIPRGPGTMQMSWADWSCLKKKGVTELPFYFPAHDMGYVTVRLL